MFERTDGSSYKRPLEEEDIGEAAGIGSSSEQVYTAPPPQRPSPKVKQPPTNVPSTPPGNPPPNPPEPEPPPSAGPPPAPEPAPPDDDNAENDLS